MCGRYSLTTPPSALQNIFEVKGPTPNLSPRYNLAPSQDAPVVRRSGDGAGREFAMLRWGLVPSWAKAEKSGYSMINARAETVTTKPAFRSLIKSRRCLVPADGFYEWQQQGKRKQPYRILMQDDAPFALAGLWDRWRGPDDAVIESFTIIVTEANDLIRPIHDRMPVVLGRTDYALWLGEDEASDGAATKQALELLRPYPAAAMRLYPVDPRVNNPRNDDPDLLAAADLLAGGGG